MERVSARMPPSRAETSLAPSQKTLRKTPASSSPPKTGGFSAEHYHRLIDSSVESRFRPGHSDCRAGPKSPIASAIRVISQSLLPACRNSRATVSYPNSSAQLSGVHPPFSLAFGSAPASSKARTAATCPFIAALCSGVETVSSSLASDSAPASSNTFTTPACPRIAAICRGVSLLQHRAFGSAPLASRRRATFSCPRIAASCSSVFSLLMVAYRAGLEISALRICSGSNVTLMFCHCG